MDAKIIKKDGWTNGETFIAGRKTSIDNVDNKNLTIPEKQRNKVNQAKEREAMLDESTKHQSNAILESVRIRRLKSVDGSSFLTKTSRSFIK